MSTSKILLIVSSVFIGLFSSCSSQRYVSSETDDIYYSASDRYAENNNDNTIVQEISGEDYKSVDDYNGNYYSVGKEQPKDQNRNAQGAYESSVASYSNNASTGSNSGVTNNFYGNTTYSEGDYYDDSYATNLKRFNQNNVNMSYGFYDPYFIDPYWNYGWSYWNPYPFSGVNIGYSSRYGWNAGYSYGWGNIGYRPWYNQPLWYRHMGNYSYWDYYSYGYPYGGYGSCYGGYGSYWNGYGSYWNGYGHGYNDGYYSGGGQNRESRPTYNGRRPSVSDNGFSGSTRVPISQTGDAPKTGKLASANGNSNETKVQNIAVRDLESSNNQAKRNNERFDGKGIYQVSNTNQQVTKDINSRSEMAYNQKVTKDKSEKYSVSGGSHSAQVKQSKMGETSSPNSAQASNVSATSRHQSSYSGSSRASYEGTTRTTSSYSSPASTTRYSSPEGTTSEMNSRGYISRSSNTSYQSNTNNSTTDRTTQNYQRNGTSNTNSNARSNYNEVRGSNGQARQPVSPQTQPSTRQRTVPQQSAPSRSNYERPSKSDRMNSSPINSGSMDRSPASSGGTTSPRSSGGGRR